MDNNFKDLWSNLKIVLKEIFTRDKKNAKFSYADTIDMTKLNSI